MIRNAHVERACRRGRCRVRSALRSCAFLIIGLNNSYFELQQFPSVLQIGRSMIPEPYKQFPEYVPKARRDASAVNGKQRNASY